MFGSFKDIQEFVQACSDGNDRALEFFLDRYYGLIRSIVNYRISNTHDRDDVCQDIFARFFQQKIFDRFQGKTEAEFKGYISRIAYNCIVDFYKKNAKKTGQEMSLEMDESSVNSFHELATELDIPAKLESRYLHMRLDKAVGRLEWKYQNVMRLRLLGFTNIQIAEATGKPKGTIDTWSFQAIKILRSELKDLKTNLE